MVKIYKKQPMDNEESTGLTWISIHDKTQKMPVRKDFYVKFDNGEIRMHFDDRHPKKALITHYALMPECKNQKP